jgi:beta-1,4-N-acetylglucosaminyltransferase
MILKHYRKIDLLGKKLYNKVTNGPGTCVPIALVYCLLNNLNITHTKIIFIESWCRVNNLSTTGKIMKWLAHERIVHWQ